MVGEEVVEELRVVVVEELEVLEVVVVVVVVVVVEEARNVLRLNLKGSTCLQNKS